MKIYFAYSILGMISAASLLSCHASKDTASVGGPASQLLPWELKYEQGPCFGKCPEFTFYLLADNSGLVDIKANWLEPGWYYADLDQESVHAILMDIESKEWWTEDLSQQTEIADLPQMSIVYKHKEGARTLKVERKISNQMSAVFEKIGQLVREARWVSTTQRPLSPKG